MNFRSNNWMIRDSKTKCTKRTWSSAAWCTPDVLYTHTQSMHCPSVIVCGCCRGFRWTELGATAPWDHAQSNLNAVHCRLCIYLSTSVHRSRCPHDDEIVLVTATVHTFVRWPTCVCCECIVSMFHRLKCAVRWSHHDGCKSFRWLVLSFTLKFIRNDTDSQRQTHAMHGYGCIVFIIGCNVIRIRSRIAISLIDAHTHTLEHFVCN